MHKFVLVFFFFIVLLLWQIDTYFHKRLICAMQCSAVEGKRPHCKHNFTSKISETI